MTGARAVLDERLDRRHDAVQKFEQFFLANLVRVVAEGLRLGQPAVTTHRGCRNGSPRNLSSRVSCRRLRQIDPLVFGKFPPGPLVEAGVAGADREQPE